MCYDIKSSNAGVLKKMKCNKCKKHYNPKDGIVIFASFECYPCLGHGIERAKKGGIKPVDTFWKKFFILFGFGILVLLFSQFAFALNQQVVHGETTLGKNERFNITLNVTESLINDTHTWPLFCSINETTKCDITRTLDFGETFVRNDDVCAIDIRAKECNADAFQNISYQIRWHVQGSEDQINITYVDTNDTRTFTKTQKFTFEEEFDILCEEVVEEESCEFDPADINITDQQFYNWCFGPFSQAADTVNDINARYLTDITKCNQEKNEILESNRQLSEQKGSCDELNKNLNECRNTVKGLENKERQCQENYQSARDKVKSNSWKGTALFFHIIFDVILLATLGPILLMNRLSKDQEDK